MPRKSPSDVPIVLWASAAEHKALRVIAAYRGKGSTLESIALEIFRTGYEKYMEDEGISEEIR